MMRIFYTFAALTAGTAPAFAASGPFFSLGNTDFVVTIAFVVFICILLYLKVPSMIGGMLDKRAAEIQAQTGTERLLDPKEVGVEGLAPVLNFDRDIASMIAEPPFDRSGVGGVGVGTHHDGHELSGITDEPFE